MATLSHPAALTPEFGPSQIGRHFRGLIGSIRSFLASMEMALTASQAYERFSLIDEETLKARGFGHGDAARAVFDLYIK